MKRLGCELLNRFYRSSSLKITIIWVFLPVIVFFIALIGFLSYWIAFLFKLYGDEDAQMKGIILFALRESFFGMF